MASIGQIASLKLGELEMGNGRLGTHQDSTSLVVGILIFLKYLLWRQLPSKQNLRNPFHSVRGAFKGIRTANNLVSIASRVRWKR